MWSISEMSQQECVLITSSSCFILRVMCLLYYHMCDKKRKPNKIKKLYKSKAQNSVELIEHALFCISVKGQQSIFLASN